MNQCLSEGIDIERIMCVSVQGGRKNLNGLFWYKMKEATALRRIPIWMRLDGTCPQMMVELAKRFLGIHQSEQRALVEEFVQEWPTYAKENLVCDEKIKWTKKGGFEFKYKKRAKQKSRKTAFQKDGATANDFNGDMPFRADSHKPKSSAYITEADFDEDRYYHVKCRMLREKGWKPVVAGKNSSMPPEVGSRILFAWSTGFHVGKIIEVEKSGFKGQNKCLNTVVLFDDSRRVFTRLVRSTVLELNPNGEHGDLHPDATNIVGKWTLIEGPELEGDPLLGKESEDESHEDDDSDSVDNEVSKEISGAVTRPYGLAGSVVFPILSFWAWNTNGMSLGAGGDIGKGLRKRVAIDRGINVGALKHAVIAISEANMKTSHLPAIYRRWSNTHYVHSNPGVNGRQGVLFFINKEATKEFQVTSEQIGGEPLAKGHILFAVMKHRATGDVVIYINLYLKSGDRQSRLKQIALTRQKYQAIAASNVGSKIYVVGGGDLNMQPDSDENDNAALRFWLDEIGATEVPLSNGGQNQDGEEEVQKFTFVARRKFGGCIRRHLDRVFIGGPDLEMLTQLYARPVLKLADMPLSSARASDHRALSLIFHPLQIAEEDKKKRNFLSQEWVATDPTFLEQAKKCISKYLVKADRKQHTMMARMRYITLILKKSAKFAVLKKAKRIPNSLSEIRLLDKFIQTVFANRSTKEIDDAARKLQCGITKEFYLKGDMVSSITKAKARLNSLVTSVEDKESQDDDEVRVTDDTLIDPLSVWRNDSKSNNSFAKCIRGMLKASRTKLVAVTGNDGVIYDTPAGVGREVHAFWSHILREPEVNDEKSNAYLEKSERKLKDDRIGEITLAEIKKIIMGAADKSAGPDGISLPIFKALCDELSPVLLGIIQQLSADDELNEADAKTFNMGTLICIPKKSNGCGLDDLRGITIGNYANRIVSAAIKNAIQPAFEDPEVIDKRQFAFLKNRLMTDAINEVLDRFYTSLQRGESAHILQIDFSKCYDNVSRSFMLKILEKWGLRKEFINAIRRLHENVKSVVWCAPEYVIEVNRSIKQGDPLACLLVLPVLQILCDEVDRRCAKIDENGRIELIQLVAFCDDLTFILKGKLDQRFKELIETIVNFCESGSDFVVNAKKTTLMSTEILSSEELKLIEGTQWKNITRVSRSVILGIDFGTKVDEEDIWLKKVKKVELLAAECGKHGMMSPGKRMRYANVYLIPILLFTAQFYPFPEWVVKRIEKAIGLLTLPKIKAVPLEFMYSAPEHGGMQYKLRDFVAEGKAALMRTVGSLFISKYMASLEVPAFLMEWHYLHPMCGIAYVAHKEWSEFIAACKVWKVGGELTQKELTKVFQKDQIRRTRAREMVHEAFSRWSGEKLGIAGGEGWNEKCTNVLFDRLESEVKSRKVGRARWITMLLGFNGLPTKTRCRVMEKEDERPKRNVGDERIRCKLCGGDHGEDDDVVHLFSKCIAVEKGKQLIVRWLQRKYDAKERQENSKSGSGSSKKVLEGHVKKSKKSKNDGGQTREGIEINFIDHLLGGNLPAKISAEDICFINATIWDVRCMYTANLDFDFNDVPEAMLRNFQESNGYRTEITSKEMEKREDKSRKAKSKKDAKVKVYDEVQGKAIEFLRYKVEDGVKITNEIPEGCHPLFDDGNPLRRIFKKGMEESESIPFVRFTINGKGKYEHVNIPDGFCGHFDVASEVPETNESQHFKAQMEVITYGVQKLNVDTQIFNGAVEGARMEALIRSFRKLSIEECKYRNEMIFLKHFKTIKMMELASTSYGKQSDIHKGNANNAYIMGSNTTSTTSGNTSAGTTTSTNTATTSFRPSYSQSYAPSYYPSTVPTSFMSGPYISE